MSRQRDARVLLVLAALISVVLWRIPHGPTILYPFTLLATYAHEMGHGITAMLMGASFESLQMNPDGSGLAQWVGRVGNLGRALIAAGGLVGPSIAGALILVISKKPERARTLVLVLGVLIGLSAVLWARNVFGIVFILTTSAIFVLVARFASQIAPLFVQLVGVQLCVAVFRDYKYMFSETAGSAGPSDSAQIASALVLPYWFWGGVTAIISVTVLSLGLYYALWRPVPVKERVVS